MIGMATKFNTVNPHDKDNIFAFAQCFELDSLSILVPSSPKKEVPLLYYWHNSSIFSLDEWNEATYYDEWNEATYYDAISLTSLPLHNALNWIRSQF